MMKLNFLGNAYTASVAGSPAPETGETGTFLGKRYKLKQTAISHRQPSTELTYRGVPYRR